MGPPEPAEPDLSAILERHVEALGGRANLESIDSMRVTGQVSASGGRRALVVREIARPGRVRTEFTFQGVTGVYAYDGNVAWEVSPLEGSLSPVEMSAEETAHTAGQADIDGPLVDWQAKGHQVALVGTTHEGERELYELEVTLAGGSVQSYFLDAETYLHVRTVATRELEGRTIEVDTVFGDYRAVGGVQLPHAIETGALERPQRMSIVVTEVELNPELTEDRFAMPGCATA